METRGFLPGASHRGRQLSLKAKAASVLPTEPHQTRTGDSSARFPALPASSWESSGQAGSRSPFSPLGKRATADATPTGDEAAPAPPSHAARPAPLSRALPHPPNSADCRCWSPKTSPSWRLEKRGPEADGLRTGSLRLALAHRKRKPRVTHSPSSPFGKLLTQESGARSSLEWSTGVAKEPKAKESAFSWVARGQ